MWRTCHARLCVAACLWVEPAFLGSLRLKCDGTRAETRFRLSAKRTSLFKSVGASVQSTTGSRGVRISGSNVGYTKFRGSVKGTGYPLHLPVSPSLPLPCVAMCYYVPTGLYTFSCLVILRRKCCSFIAYLSVPSFSKDSDTIDTECSVTFVSNLVLASCFSALIFFMLYVNKYQLRQSSDLVNLWCLTSLAVWIICFVFFCVTTSFLFNQF
jgi:hypothetical protein